MYSKTVTVKNPSGLHARPASDFVAAAGKYKGIKLKVGREGDPQAVNAKSIVMVLSLGVIQGEAITISSDSDDGLPAVDELAALVESGFGE